ncbi:hypothetical protein O181_086720 [Austropuccinia psidii MF-1]|uniref:Uncharacterized protein n=1 Tax=Austropuccinia psidii MF-1 TaxID=1389203 RepID=A0A9Q3FUS8_9BASI|nr:hypothetical protein [Austropuccinia psidii MF-1]
MALVGLFAQFSRRLAKPCGRTALAIMRLARERAIRSGIVIQSHPNSKNEGIWRVIGQYTPVLDCLESSFTKLHMQFLTLLHGPDASHCNPYAQHFTHHSLSLSRFPRLHMRFLMLGQVPNTLQANPHA